MSKEVIPEQIRVTCDVCHVVCGSNNRKQSGGIIIKRDGLDFQGQAVGDATIKLDLCDTCLGRAIQNLNHLTNTIREEKKHE